jgi:hypothetical protein
VRYTFMVALALKPNTTNSLLTSPRATHPLGFDGTVNGSEYGVGEGLLGFRSFSKSIT